MTVARLSLLLLLGSAAGAAAQYAPPSVTTPPPPTYGVQPYNPAEPTGFRHPNDTGFGRYRNPTRLKGHRTSIDRERRFRGY